jgi:hypothetical protein
MSDIKRIWQHQANFNRMLRGEPPTSFEERSKLSKDFALNQYSEIDEFQRTTKWKAHRRISVKPNPAHQIEELVDQFKMWMTQCQLWGFTLEEVMAAYWRKSAVVHQRYVEEWISQLNDPCVIVDIDNVLCDYITGFCRWVAERHPTLAEQTSQLVTKRLWVNAESMGLDDGIYQAIKHEFRVTGGKRHLPVIDGAREYLTGLRASGVKVVLLTSRPIDRYPNIFTDTIDWLGKNQLAYDFIWWATDKGERILEAGIRDRVLYVVDDDIKYIRTFAGMGLRCFWLRLEGTDELTSDDLDELKRYRGRITVVTSIDELPTTKEQLHA